MFNPLIGNLADLKTQDLENRIFDLNKKYWIAARTGNGHLCEQIGVALETFRSELQMRNYQASRLPMRNGNDGNLDDLININ